MAQFLPPFFVSLNLRRKTLVIIASTLGVLITVLYVVTSLVIKGGFAHVERELSRGFSTIEQRHAVTNVARVQNAIDTAIANLAVRDADWAQWDDTYQFIMDHNAAYIASNLTDGALSLLQINLLLMIDREGTLVYGSAFDLEQGQPLPVPASMAAYTAKGGELLRFRDNEDIRQGILLLPEGPLMVVSRPITKSDGTGEMHGAFIIGRYLDRREVASLATLTHLALTAQRADGAHIPPEIRDGVARITAAAPIAVVEDSRDTLSAYAVLNDMFARPALYLKVEIPRDIHHQAEITLASIARHSRFTLLSLVLSIVFTGLMLGWTILFLLETAVISRLAALSRATGEIGASGDFAVRVAFDGNDEITSLSRSVNEMLEGLALSHQEITQQRNDLAEKGLALAAANKQITDNIEYAKRIQTSLLPAAATIEACLGECLIIWRPKDIVSGDLYFVHPTADGFLLVLMDCTGHGVSGAFMTLIAHSALATIVHDQGCWQPGQILTRLNSSLKGTLCQVDSQAPSNDGLDAAACLYDRRQRTLSFAGARRPLLLLQAGELSQIDGDRQSIGYREVPNAYAYQERQLRISAPATVYLCSDGYSDQMGGKGLPFGKKRFQQQLLRNAHRPFAEQERRLLDALDAYRGEREINDDITIIGFRL